MPNQPLSYLAFDVLKQYPRLYLPLARRFNRTRDGQDRAVARDTALVIEAFPRSGNTYARFAFELSQPRPVKLAHHLHAPAQVIAAARWGVPCLVIIRDPREAALSFHIRAPVLSLAGALQSYLRFYRRIEPHRDSYVLAKFETVTNDFGHVMQAVNARFNADFVIYERTEANEEAVFARMDEHHGRTRPTDRHAEQTTSRPAPLKESRKQSLRAELDSDAVAPWRNAAMQLYERLVRGADV